MIFHNKLKDIFDFLNEAMVLISGALSIPHTQFAYFKILDNTIYYINAHYKLYENVEN